MSPLRYEEILELHIAFFTVRAFPCSYETSISMRPYLQVGIIKWPPKRYKYSIMYIILLLNLCADLGNNQYAAINTVTARNWEYRRKTRLIEGNRK